MVSTYLEIAVFGAVALLVPVLMLAFSKLVRPPGENSVAETQPFESAEASVGRGVTPMNEYAHYFAVFAAFAVLCAIMVAWSLTAKQLDFIGNVRMGALLAMGVFLEFFVLAMGRRRV